VTPKQARFVSEYLQSLNATQAAVRAGYSPKTAEQQAWQLLQKPLVQQAIVQGKATQIEQADVSAVRVLQELRSLALVDARDFFDSAGNLKPIKDLSAAQGAALSSFEIIIKNAAAGDGHLDTIHKIKLWDKTRALEMLAKHFKLLTEVVQIEATDALLARLDKGRERAAKVPASTK